MELLEEQLIECVRGYECIYDNTSADYRNASLKQNAWEQIATELNSTVSDCRAKWNLLRNAFVHAISRRKTVTGQGVKNFKKWKFEEEMSFLLPYMTNRSTISNFIGEGQNSEQDSNDNSNENNNENITPRKTKNNNYQEQILNVIKERGRKVEKNDIDLFFETMAKTVKNFPKMEQVKLKFEIMKLVHEVELRCLDSITECSGSSNTTPTISRPSTSTFIHHRSSPYLRKRSASPESTSSSQIALQSPTPVTQQYSSPQYVPQFSPSPQIGHQSRTPVTQQFSTPDYVPPSLSLPLSKKKTKKKIVCQSSSPITQQCSSAQYVPQPSLSLKIAHQSRSSATQQYSSTQYMPQSSPSPQRAHQSRSSATQQYSSTQYVPQSSSSPQSAHQSHQSHSSATQQSVQYLNIHPSPSTSQISFIPSYSQSHLLQTTHDSVDEISIPSPANTTEVETSEFDEITMPEIT